MSAVPNGSGFMAETIRLVKQQRLVLSAALLVGLVLIFLVHAPWVPVVMGCLLASVYAIARSVARSSAKGNR